MNIYSEFIRNRITQLREERRISERKLSLELGKNHSYFNNISNGRGNISMSEFLILCEYLKITPKDFFDVDTLPNVDSHLLEQYALSLQSQAEKELPPKFQQAIRLLSKANEEELENLLFLLRRFFPEE